MPSRTESTGAGLSAAAIPKSLSPRHGPCRGLLRNRVSSQAARPRCDPTRAVVLLYGGEADTALLRPRTPCPAPIFALSSLPGAHAGRKGPAEGTATLLMMALSHTKKRTS